MSMTSKKGELAVPGGSGWKHAAPRSIGLPRGTVVMAVFAVVLAVASQGQGQAGEKADAAEFAAKLTIAGVKPGMTKAQAEAAIKAFNPGLVAVELYAATNGGFVYHRPKFQFRPANTAFFTELAVLPRSRFKRGTGPLTQADLESGWTFANDGHPDCGGDLTRTSHTPDSVTYHVLFTADLKDPRVALIEEEHGYCARALTVQQVIGKLYEKWGKTPVSKQGIRQDGLRVTPDLLPGAGQLAFLEWRYTSPMARLQPMNANGSMVNGASGLFEGFGNKGGGIAARAEITPTQDLAYMDRVNTALWDDATMLDYYARIGWMLSEMDRLGISIDKIADKELTAKVKPYHNPNDPPEAPKGAPQFDAFLKLGMLFPRLARGGLTLQKGMGLYHVADLDAMYKRTSYPEPRTWFTIDPAVCAEHPDFDCSKPMAFKDTDWKAIDGGQPSIAALVTGANRPGNAPMTAGARNGPNAARPGAPVAGMSGPAPSTRAPGSLPGSTADSANVFGVHVGDKWTGDYTCTQGKTGLDVTVTGMNGQQVMTRVDFYPIAETRIKIQPAAYSAQGVLGDDGTLRLAPSSWIVKPGPYFMATLAGTFTADFLQYSGTVPECGRNKTFTIHKVVAAR